MEEKENFDYKAELIYIPPTAEKMKHYKDKYPWLGKEWTIAQFKEEKNTKENTMLTHEEIIEEMTNQSEELLLKFTDSVEKALHDKNQMQCRLIISSYTAFLVKAMSAIGSLLPDQMLESYFAFLAEAMNDLYRMEKRERKERENGG